MMDGVRCREDGMVCDAKDCSVQNEGRYKASLARIGNG